MIPQPPRSAPPPLPRQHRTSYLELPTIHFKQDGDAGAFRVSLTKPPSKLISIWIECKRTKAQWLCAVSRFQDHTPADANYVLPPDVVLDALEGALRRAADDPKPSTSDDSLAFLMGNGTPATLVLDIKPRASFCATYIFEMTPLARDATDILLAKLRDVEDELMQLRRQNPISSDAVVLTLKCPGPTIDGNDIEWVVQHDTRVTAVQVNDECDVSIRHGGVYCVEVHGTPSCEDCRFRVFVDKEWRVESVGVDMGVFVSTTLILPSDSVLNVEVVDNNREDNKVTAESISNATMRFVLVRDLPKKRQRLT
ncbi:Aste57867_10284 [Aphanomyces stellatus]|uniref:Aste57867_10284 protein n=1 Tax=Aphanomyces stellatus TaxID=120398 RepID=A0A485KPY6_9STRA|nr:hypothetical protein As57867_010244 [Aphanomyces stellatus]VFT87158.1 Aste57867_10284 [Aphanomyces stellatus]